MRKDTKEQTMTSAAPRQGNGFMHDQRKRRIFGDVVTHEIGRASCRERV